MQDSSQEEELPGLGPGASFAPPERIAAGVEIPSWLLDGSSPGAAVSEFLLKTWLWQQYAKSLSTKKLLISKTIDVHFQILNEKCFYGDNSWIYNNKQKSVLYMSI